MDSPLADKSRSSSPNVMHEDPASSSGRGNPFSIDYILSNAKQQNSASAPHESGALLLQQLSLIQHHHQQQQFMSPTSVGPELRSPASSMQSDAQIKLMDSVQRLQQQQQQQPQQQSPPQHNPSFLYFMACMLLQQQQQQQQQANQQAALAARQQQQQQFASAPRLLNPIEVLAQLTADANPASPAGRRKVFDMNPPQMNRKSTNAAPNYQLTTTTADPSNQLGLFQPGAASYGSALSANSRAAATSQGSAGFLNGGSGTDYQYFASSKPTSRSHQPTRPNCPPLTTNSTTTPTPTAISSANKQDSNNNNNNTNNRQQQLQTRTEKVDNLKPAHSYIGLIGMCILSTPEKRMVLNDIYQFILDQYPYYRNRGSGWRNSVRHNLSLNECFQKSGRAANGKGHYWTIHPANMEDFMNGDFRRRRAQRKVRRWNNMDVPSDESDDESTEDANRPPLPEHFKRSLEMHSRLEALGYHGPPPQHFMCPPPAQSQPTTIGSTHCPMLAAGPNSNNRPAPRNALLGGNNNINNNKNNNIQPSICPVGLVAKPPALAKDSAELMMRAAAQAIAAAMNPTNAPSTSSSKTAGQVSAPGDARHEPMELSP